MGFGILFIGYFLLLNFAYCDFTDAISAVLILYALFKLSFINQNFKISSRIAIAFTTFSLVELSVATWEMFVPSFQATVLFSTLALIRHLILAFLSFTLLLGIRDVAGEVGLADLKKKSTVSAYASVAVYGINILLESVTLANFIDAKYLAVAYVLAIFMTLAITVVNLVRIYTAYMRICMPGDEDMNEKASKFAFVNAFRRHEEEKAKEYAEYRLEKLKAKKNKKGGQGK